jgi:hypothetical protein
MLIAPTMTISTRYFCETTQGASINGRRFQRITHMDEFARLGEATLDRHALPKL